MAEGGELGGITLTVLCAKQEQTRKREEKESEGRKEKGEKGNIFKELFKDMKEIEGI